MSRINYLFSNIHEFCKYTQICHAENLTNFNLSNSLKHWIKIDILKIKTNVNNKNTLDILNSLSD